MEVPTQQHLRCALLARVANSAVWSLSAEGSFNTPEASWEMFTGQSFPDYRGYGWLNAYHPSDHEKLKLLLAQRRSENANILQFAARLWSRHTQSYHHVVGRGEAIRNSTGQFVQWVGTSADVTELREAEEKLRQAVEDLQLALSSADTGAFRLECSSNGLAELTMTDQGKKVLGFSAAAQVTLRAFLDRVDPNDRQRVSDAVCSFERCERLDLHFRVNIPDAAPSLRFVSMKGDIAQQPISPDIRVVTGVIMDVTERTMREQERAAALEQTALLEKQRAHKAEEMRAQQKEFLDTMCHELRNPLQGTAGASELLRDDLRDAKEAIATQVGTPEATPAATEATATAAAAAAAGPTAETVAAAPLESASHNLDIIDECTRLQKEIADDVLDMSRMGLGKLVLRPESFPLRKLFNSLTTMFTAALQLRELYLDVRVPEVYIRADYARLLQVFVNLISNAIKFTLKGGKIAINVSLEQDALLRATIQDSGVGMSEEQLASLFERFSAQNPMDAGTQGGGSGLGLSVAKKFVDLMHGTLEFSSEKGHGTCVHLVVPVEVLPGPPLESAQQQQPPTTEWSHSRVLLQQKHVLVVDDNVVVRRILERFLQGIGCTFASATNGAEALELVQQSVRFDAVLMDLHMPVMDGIEATRRIREIEQREKRPPLWIIALTGDVRPEQKAAAMQGGMNDYLTKPYHRDGVLAALSCIGQNESKPC